LAFPAPLPGSFFGLQIPPVKKFSASRFLQEIEKIVGSGLPEKIHGFKALIGNDLEESHQLYKSRQDCEF
jgi:hypothetical protein